MIRYIMFFAKIPTVYLTLIKFNVQTFCTSQDGQQGNPGILSFLHAVRLLIKRAAYDKIS